MGITAITDITKLFDKIGAELAPIIDEVIVECFEKTLIEVTALAKGTNTYKDRTNHLRSSIGYQLYKSGELISEDFSKAGTGAEGDASGSGMQKGREVAQEAAKLWPTDIIGVLVAGADYALYVESRGYDVITGSSQQLNTLLQQNMRLAFEALNED